MTVQRQDNIVIYQGNGLATQFTYQFRIPLMEWVHVYLQDWATKEIIRELAPSEFSISGVNWTNMDGGEVTYVGPPILPSTQGIIIQRTVTLQQLLDLVNQGGFYPQTLEDQLDWTTFQIQQLAEAVSRALVVNPGDDVPSITDLLQLIEEAIAASASAAASAADAADSADEAEAWAAQLEAALKVPVYFDAWEDFKADTVVWQPGTRINTREGMSWDVVGSGGDFQRPDGLRLNWVTGKPIVVLYWGQSNMRGIIDQALGTVPRPNRMVWAWNSQVTGLEDGTQFNIATFNEDPFTASNINQLSWWCSDAIQQTENRRVYFVLVAAGGHHIEAFMNDVDLAANGWAKDPGETDLYPFMVDQIDAALPEVPGSPTIFDVVAGHQGEANREDQVEVYAHKLRIFHKRLETRGNIDVQKTRIVVGELCDGVENGRFKLRHSNACKRLQMGTGNDSFPTMKVVSSAGLEPNTALDEVHFKTDAITALGKRYADALYSHQQVQILDPCLMTDLTVDSGMGWSCSQGTATGNGKTYWRRATGDLNEFPLAIIEDDTIGWAWIADANTRYQRVTRMQYRVPTESTFFIEMEVRNTHPSAVCDINLGLFGYDKDKAFVSGQSGAAFSIPALTTQKIIATMSLVEGTIVIDPSYVWFSPFFLINDDGTGAGCRFNILRMGFTLDREPTVAQTPTDLAASLTGTIVNRQNNTKRPRMVIARMRSTTASARTLTIADNTGLTTNAYQIFLTPTSTEPPDAVTFIVPPGKWYGTNNTVTVTHWIEYQ